MPARDPSGSVKPPMTNSCSSTHFVFTQSPCAARSVGFRRSLGDDAFEAEPARLLEERAPVALDMVGVADAARLAPADQRFEPCLAIDERQGLHPFSVETQQIEDEIDQRSVGVRRSSDAFCSI